MDKRLFFNLLTVGLALLASRPALPAADKGENNCYEPTKRSLKRKRNLISPESNLILINMNRFWKVCIKNTTVTSNWTVIASNTLNHSYAAAPIRIRDL
jgi:hypothetical protein